HRSPIRNHRSLDQRRLSADFMDPMLTSIFIGAAALVAVCLCFSLFLFAHLTGRVRRGTALRVSALGVVLGATVTGHGILGSAAFGPMSIPFGVFLIDRKSVV